MISPVTESPTPSKLDLGDIGEAKLERLLTEAAEEATEKLRPGYFVSKPCSSKTSMANPTTDGRTTDETHSPTKSNTNDKDAFQSSDSSSDSESSSEPSSSVDDSCKIDQAAKLTVCKQIDTTQKTSETQIRTSWVDVPHVPVIKRFCNCSCRRSKVSIQASV